MDKELAKTDWPQTRRMISVFSATNVMDNLAYHEHLNKVQTKADLKDCKRASGYACELLGATESEMLDWGFVYDPDIDVWAKADSIVNCHCTEKAQ